MNGELASLVYRAERLLRAGDLRGADQAEEEAIEAAMASGGEESAGLAEVLGALARANCSHPVRERRARALAYAERALSLRRLLRGDETPDVLDALTDVGKACEASGDADAAYAAFARAAEGYRTLGMQSSLSHRLLLEQLCEVALRLQRFADAAAAAEELVAWTPEDDRAVSASAYSRAGATLLASRRYEDASRTLEVAVRLFMRLDERRGGRKSAATAEAEALLDRARSRNE